jgi:hypothetical protein
MKAGESISQLREILNDEFAQFLPNIIDEIASLRSQ